MSYTRSYSTTVSGSKTVSYPKSETGGSIPVTVDVPVTVNIHVDTNAYDSNIERCNRHINLLSGAVVASEAAEVKAKKDSAFKIGKSLITGFFGYVRSEISQQITILKTKIDSVILHLGQLRKGCQDKERQMSTDFSRITSRYSKIFKDLDNEVVSRISALDAPTFRFVEVMKGIDNRGTGNALLGISAVTTNESSYLHSVLFASSVKRRAQSVIEDANHFIVENYRQKRNFESVKFNMSGCATIYVPVMYADTIVAEKKESTELYGVDSKILSISHEAAEQIKSKFSSNMNWNELSEVDCSKLTAYFNSEIENHFTQSDPYSDRVKKIIQSMWNNNKTNVLSNN